MFLRKIQNNDFEEYIAHSKWITAKGYKQTPHEYIVNAPEEIFSFIKEHGYSKEFKGRKYTYFNNGGYR